MTQASQGDTGTLRPATFLWPAIALLIFSLVMIGVYLGHELTEGERFALDYRILLALRVPEDLGTPIGPNWLLQSVIDVNALGGVTLLCLFGSTGVIWLAYARKRAEALWLACSMIGSSLISETIKVRIARPRPDLVPHLAQATSASFPSGHAMNSAATYLTLALMLADSIRPVDRRVRASRIAVVAFFCLIVILIGMCRVYLGVHYPSDVIAGWCFGATWALLAWALNRRIAGKRITTSSEQ